MVSVILPTFNRAAFLAESIASVLGQDGVALELIVVDDGSEDQTAAVVSAFRDDRIRYYQLPHTGKLSKLKNFAIGRSSGEFIAFMDSDDRWTGGKLRRQVELLESNPALGFSLTDMTVFRGDTVIREYTYRHRGSVQSARIFHWITDQGFLVYNPTLVLRRSCLERTGYFNESVRSGCLAFNMRLAYHFACGVFFEPMLLRRLHDANISEEKKFQNYDEYLDAYERFYEEKKIKRRQLLKAKGNAYFKLGELYAAERQWPAAGKHYLMALRNDGFVWRYQRALLKVSWLMGMRQLTERFYRPLLLRYLAVSRRYVYKGIQLQVPAGVFHPGFFFSTKILLRYLAGQALRDRSFLELGAGSGLISLFAASKGARVTATDINPAAVDCLRVNETLNGLAMEVVHSDLFDRVVPHRFDVIAVNPPYYRKNPVTDADRAWYCGENGEYFDRFFRGLERYMHSQSDVWMILCDGCDLDMIRRLAARYGWFLRCCLVRRNWVEKNFIFRIERAERGIL